MMTTDADRQDSVKIGELAPDFTLYSHNEGELNLAWYRTRKNVVLAFYPGDWTPVCSAQIPGYEPIAGDLKALDTQIIGISVDSVASHVAWAKSLGGLSFPLMADYFPHGEVARKYGVLLEGGYADRAIFVIDKQGIIRYIDDVPISELPDNSKLLTALKEIQANNPNTKREPF